jgi:hypothetical protein
MSQFTFAAAALLVFTPLAFAQQGANSGERIRPKPGELAARAGTAVMWRTDVDAALAEAQASGKPVFWYVPTIAGSFMDRQPEVDRYMLAGPFAWPRTIALLNEKYVPVRAAADEALSTRFGLEPVGFIEPGYLVLGGDGAEAWRMDQLTTFQPRWFLAPLAEHVGAELGKGDGPGEMSLADVPKEIPARAAGSASDPRVAEQLFLAGVRAFDGGDDANGRVLWERLVAEHPESVFAPKAAMELEGHGPFLRGFEVFGPLPKSALAGRGRGSQSATPWKRDDVWAAGTAFLGRVQNAAGGFEDSTYDFGGTDGLPNVYVSVTAIAAMVLETARELKLPTEKSAELARQYALDDTRLNLADTDEQIWAHLYRLRFLAAAIEADPEAKAWASPAANHAVRAIVAMQGESGPWAHEYPNPFVTASVLVALHDIARHDVSVDRAVIDRALDALEKCRTAEGAFTYGMPRREARAAVEASVARAPLCELALLQWGRGSQDRLLEAVAASFEHEAPLVSIRKYDDHTRFHAYGGFFFWYGLQGRAEAIGALADAAARARFAQRATEQILALPEYDGCFVDSHEIGRAYGTAMALWSLDILERATR